MNQLNQIPNHLQEKLKEFTPGTKFTSKFGAPSVVATPQHAYEAGGCIFIKCEGGPNATSPFRMIYDNSWAEIEMSDEELESRIDEYQNQQDYERMVTLGHHNERGL